MSHRRSLVIFSLGLMIASPLRAADPKPHESTDFVADVLGRAILGPRQTLTETIESIDARIPRMPEPRTVAEWEPHADRMRADVLEKVIYQGEAAAWRDAPDSVAWLETIEGGPGYRIKKLRYEAVPGFWIPALLYEPKQLTGKVPAVLNVNGHDAKGKSADYKQVRCINLAKRGMLALNVEWIGMGQLADGNCRHDLINHIDLCGTSGIATHYLAQKRALDVLLAHEHADPDRVAVTGLSGGGWQTIFFSALDPRVKLTNPVAGYSSLRTRVRNFSDLGDSEQTPTDLDTVTDYAQLTAMMAPRPTLLTFNAHDDCCFAADHALPPLLAAAAPIFKLYGKESNLRSHVNEDPGTHNYLRDNREAFYRMIGDHFFTGQTDYVATEIASDPEVKSRETLDVALPADNASLHSLALGLSKSLPLNRFVAADKAAAQAWRDAHRASLREILRARTYDPRGQETGREEKGGVKVKLWRIKLGEWTVPVVELAEGDSKKTTLLVADSGRQGASVEARKLIAEGGRVLAVDPFYVGESKILDHDYLFALGLATVGDRPLGLQASQLAAVARWAKAEHAGEPVTILAIGPRSSVMALAAAGLEETAIDGVNLQGSLGSLKELIETKAGYPESPELFCFGLLKGFDIAQLAALVAPRPVVFKDPSPRASKELAGLKAWYRAWGVDWEPLR